MKPEGLIAALTLLLAALASPAFAGDVLRVDITEGESGQPLYAVSALPAGPIAGVGRAGEDSALAIARVIHADLSDSGYFRLQTERPQLSSTDVSFGQWQKQDVAGLVVSRIYAQDRKILKVDCRLFDVFAEKVAFSKMFYVEFAQWRRAAHKCADAVFEFKTGYTGHFDTQIAFASRFGAQVAGTRRLAIMDYDGENLGYLTNGISMVAGPRFSPDGRVVVYMSYVDRQTVLQLYELGSARIMKLLLPEGVVYAPRFSPDGRFLAFSLGVDGQSQIHLLTIANGERRQLTHAPGINTSPSFSPDGTRLVFESTRSGTQQLYVVNIDGTDPTRISFGPGRYASPDWSPIGDWIAFSRIDDDQAMIGVMQPDGAKERFLTKGAYDETPSWAPSGRALMFVRNGAEAVVPEIWRTDFAARLQSRIEVPEPEGEPGWSGVRP